MLPQGRLTLDQATRKNTSSSKRRWRPDSVATHYRDVPPIKCLPSELSQAFLALLMNSVQAVGTLPAPFPWTSRVTRMGCR